MYTWSTTFTELFQRCITQHKQGKTFASWFSAADTAFLESIGYTQQEFFDFVDDHCNYGDPSIETALLIAAVRRDYFLVEQRGKRSDEIVSPDQLPPKAAEVEGIAWLPRIIAKARAKLRGEMDPDTMYDCGGDRMFLSQRNIHPADFLRVTWAAREDDQRIIDYVKSASALA